MIWRILSKYLKLLGILFIFILTVGASNPVVSVYKKTILGPGDFNSNNAWFEFGPPELGWPLPEPRKAYAQGNYAEVYLSASPGQAGNAQAQLYLIFDWDVGGYSWEDVKNMELELTVDFSYQIKAFYTPYGSSNAGVTIRGLPGNFDSYWYDYVGHQYGTTGGDIPINRVKKFKTTVLDLDNLGRVLYGHIVCQALLPDFGQTTQGLTNSSSATLTINSITIQPIPKTYGLFVGTSYDEGKQNALNGSLLVTNVRDTWSLWDKVDFAPPLTATLEQGGLLDTTIRDAIKKISDDKQPQPGDNFIFYFIGHSWTDGSGLNIGGDNLPSGTLSKEKLKEYLKPMVDRKVNILVILDSCFAHSFWDALGTLPRTALITPANVNGKAVYNRAVGTFLSWKLKILLGLQIIDKHTFDTNDDDAVDWNEFVSKISLTGADIEGMVGQLVFLAAVYSSDPVVFTLDMWQPFSQKSADFNGVFSGEPKTRKALPGLMLLLD